MRIVVTLFCLFSLSLSSIAQTNTPTGEVQAATQELKTQYQLDDQQTVKVQEIQARKFRNLAEIEPLKSSDNELYLKKRQGVLKGANASLKRLLNEQQLVIFKEQEVAERKRQSDIIKALKAKGASKEEILRALLEM